VFFFSECKKNAVSLIQKRRGKQTPNPPTRTNILTFFEILASKAAQKAAQINKMIKHNKH
jgi:hypothetical protein